MTATDADRAKAADAIERGAGICRTCLAPIWNEGGTVGHVKRAEGWSDRIETGGDSLVCFKAVEYRHVPLAGREAAIYDHAYARGASERAAAVADLRARVEAVAEELEEEGEHSGPAKGAACRIAAARLRAAVADTTGDPA